MRPVPAEEMHRQGRGGGREEMHKDKVEGEIPPGKGCGFVQFVHRHRAARGPG